MGMDSMLLRMGQILVFIHFTSRSCGSARPSRRSGKLTRFSGENGAEREVTEEKGSCHKRFRTKAQAEAFIEDWKESYAEIWYELIKEALDRGFRPRDIGAFRSREMGSIIEQFLRKPSISTDVDDIAGKTAKQLSLQDNKQKK